MGKVSGETETGMTDPRGADASSVAREWLPYLLMAEKGFERVELAPGDYRGQAIVDVMAEQARFSFVGTRKHWGQPTFIAIVDTDGLDRAGMERSATLFFDLVIATHSLMGGTWGLLCFVFERPPTPAMIEHVRTLKLSLGGRKAWMAAWTIDLSTGRVTQHSGGPFGLYPGRAYIEGAIRRARDFEGPPPVIALLDAPRRGEQRTARWRVLVWVIGIVLALLFAWANGYHELIGELAGRSS